MMLFGASSKKFSPLGQEMFQFLIISKPTLTKIIFAPRGKKDKNKIKKKNLDELHWDKTHFWGNTFNHLNG